MMSIIDPLRPGDSPNPKVNQRLEEARSQWWNDSAFFGLLGHSPNMLEAIIQLFQTAVSIEGVPLHILELMRLKGSEINKCEYCVNMRFAAVKEEVSTKEDAIFGSINGKALDKQEFLAVRLAEQMASNPNDIPTSFFEELRTEFSEQQILGLVFAAAAFGMGNKINSTLKLQAFECSIA